SERLSASRVGDRPVGVISDAGILANPLRATLSADYFVRISSRWPAPFAHRDRLQPRRIDDDVLDAPTLPGVSDVDEAVGPLNDGRVRVLAWPAFENGCSLPRATILRQRHVERRPPPGRMIVDDEA